MKTEWYLSLQQSNKMVDPDMLYVFNKLWVAFILSCAPMPNYCDMFCRMSVSQYSDI